MLIELNEGGLILSLYVGDDDPSNNIFYLCAER